MLEISVVIPVYNRREAVGDAVRSALAQTLPPVEVLVVDDGSTDGSADAAAGFGGPVRVLRMPNQGPSAARNTGIKAAKGDAVAFLDSDDVWQPQCLERLAETLQAERADMVFGDVQIQVCGEVAVLSLLHQRRVSAVLGSGAGRIPDCFAMLLLENFIHTSTVMVRREALVRAGMFDESLRSVEDRDMWLRVARSGVVACVPEVVATVRRDGHGLSEDQVLASASRIKVLSRYINDPVLSGAYRRKARAALCEHHTDLAYHLVQAGKFRDAAAHYAKAFGLSGRGRWLVRAVAVGLGSVAAVPFIRRGRGSTQAARLLGG